MVLVSRRLSFLGVALLFLIGLAACTQPSTPPAVPPTQRASETPTNTPGAAQEPTLAPNTVYENAQFGLRFEAPPGYQHFDPAAFWDLSDGVLWAAGFSAPDDREPLAYQAPLGVTVYANPDDLPLADWFKQHSGAPTADPNTQIHFFDPLAGEVKPWNGNPSLHYVRAREPQREEILIARPGIVVGVHYASGLTFDYQPAYEHVLGTLIFTGSPATPGP